jgi:hypothetical protein
MHFVPLLRKLNPASSAGAACVRLIVIHWLDHVSCGATPTGAHESQDVTLASYFAPDGHLGLKRCRPRYKPSCLKCKRHLLDFDWQFTCISNIYLNFDLVNP